jgi:ribosomal protein S27AE
MKMIAVRCPRCNKKMANHVEGRVWHTCIRCDLDFVTNGLVVDRAKMPV